MLAAAFLAAALPAAAYEPVLDVPEDFKMPAPLSLEESVASLRTRPGLRVELVAAEPLVADPVNFEWGPDGRLWVVEMADYPLGVDASGRPGGRVRCLEDRDGDGRYETSTLFLDGLPFPTGVKPWRDGVLVIACPEILLARDTDGDGRADTREVLYRGFAEGNQQHRVNGLEWAHGGWLQVANGDSGGTVESMKTGEKLELGSFDLAIHPDSGAMRRLTGRTQYGRVRDDAGDWFGCSNSRPIFQFQLEDAWLRRNPHVVYPPGARDIDSGEDPRRVFPLSRGGQRYNDPHAENRFTSACGLGILRDGRLGEAYRGSAFICEPVHNLVSRRVLERDGAGYRAVRAADEADSEFLASTDHWFRPVAAKTGPDGAIWVADMHRYVIEHPEWIPEPWQAVLDLRAGHDRGRLYRIVSDHTAPSAAPEAIDGLGAEALTERLRSDNGWLRDVAEQVLYWRNTPPDPTIALATGGDAAWPHVLGWFGEGKAPVDLLLRALESEQPARQRLALRLLPDPVEAPALRDAVVRLARQPPDAATALAAAVALGAIATPEAGEALAALLHRHGDDPIFAAAAISSLVPHLDTVAATLSRSRPIEERLPLLPPLLETAIGLDRREALAHLLAMPDPSGESGIQIAARLLSVLDRRGVSLDAFREKAGAGPLGDALDRVGAAAEQSRTWVGDPAIPESRRLAAIALLGREKVARDADIDRLLPLLGPATSAGIQAAAASRLIEMRALGRAIEGWSHYGPAVQSRLISGALADRSDVAVLLTALENGRLPLTAIDAATRDRLLNHPQSALRLQARAVLGGAASPDRAAVMERFADALKLPGDLARGRAHFATLCAACHRLEGVGRDLGADLAALKDKSPASLLTAILDPNRAVEDKYRLYQIDLGGGRSLAGMIVAEAGESLTVQQLDGTRSDLLRSEVAGLTATGRSAMPEGLEAALDAQALADLIAFLRDAKS